jgi:hypothetical protein
MILQKIQAADDMMTDVEACATLQAVLNAFNVMNVVDDVDGDLGRPDDIAGSKWGTHSPRLRLSTTFLHLILLLRA